jgi:adenylylsulfate kinase-like enzyme
MSTGYTKEERNSGIRTLGECAEILTARGTPCTKANAFAIEQRALGKLHRAFVNDPVLREIAERMGMEVPETAASDVKKILKKIRKERTVSA